MSRPEERLPLTAAHGVARASRERYTRSVAAHMLLRLDGSTTMTPIHGCGSPAAMLGLASTNDAPPSVLRRTSSHWNSPRTTLPDAGPAMHMPPSPPRTCVQGGV